MCQESGGTKCRGSENLDSRLRAEQLGLRQLINIDFLFVLCFHFLFLVVGKESQ